MIGQIDPSRRSVTVVGAGIAGLLIADALDRKNYEVTLIEKDVRTGGLIRTERGPHGISESAAHSILATPAVCVACARLGVELVPLQADARARYIWRGGRMRRFPLGPFEALGALARAYFVLADPEPRATLADWGRRHLGRAATDYLLSPFVRGIYGAEPGELALEAAFPSLVISRGQSLLSDRLRRAWQARLGAPAGSRAGTSPSPKREMVAPASGMGSLVAALESRLRSRLGPRFQLGRSLGSLAELGPGAERRNVVLAVPAREAAGLLAQDDAELALALGQVAYTPLVSITVFAGTSSFVRVPRGVGVLIPGRESVPKGALGVLFNSSSFPGRAGAGIESFTMMFGGTDWPSAHLVSDADFLPIVRSELRRLFSDKIQVLGVVINRWERAIPRYNLGLAETQALARKRWCQEPGRVLFGNYTGQVSLRGLIEAAETLDA